MENKTQADNFLNEMIEYKKTKINYSNYLLNEIEKNFNKQFPDDKEEIKSKLSISWQNNVKQHSFDRANGILEEILISYTPVNERVNAYQILRDKFNTKIF